MIFSFSDRIDKMVFSSFSSLNETVFFRNFSFPIPNRPLTVSQPEKLWTSRRTSARRSFFFYWAKVMSYCPNWI